MYNFKENKRCTLALVLLISSFFLIQGCEVEDYYYVEDGIAYCYDAEPGMEGEVNGRDYLVVDDDMIEEAIENNRWICTSHVTNMKGLFNNEEGRAYLKERHIINWDTSNVENMEGMFEGAKEFNQDISRWDVRNVEDMSYMFMEAKSFNQNIGGWDVSNVRNMSYMFCGAELFNQDIGGWDISNVKDTSYMFCNLESFNEDISDWDTSNVENMEGMFEGAKEFNQDISDWNTSNVENMEGMFEGAKEFNQDISDWDTSNVENMEGMFEGAKEFNQDISDWDSSTDEDVDETTEDWLDEFELDWDIDIEESIYNIKKDIVSPYKEFEGITVEMDEDHHFESEFKEEFGKYDLKIQSDNGTIRAEYQNVGCVEISPGSRFEFVGEDYDDFAVFIPSHGSDYKLCLRTLPEENYNTSCDNCGLVDFINHSAEFKGIYQYEKTSTFDPKLFRNMINARGNYSMQADNQMFNNTNITFQTGEGIATFSYFDIAQVGEKICAYTSKYKENNYIINNYKENESKEKINLKGSMDKLNMKEVHIYGPDKLNYFEEYKDGIK